MFEELNYIMLSGERYPIKCDLVVLERAQEEFGSIDEFETKLMIWSPKLDEDGKELKDADGKIIYTAHFPDMKAVNMALYHMVKEGEMILAERENRTPKSMTRDQIVRKADLSPMDIADQLHKEFIRCLKIKNEKTTQNQTEEKIEAEKR